MAREFARSFYKGKAWIKCKNSYIKSVHGLCERCLKDGKIVTGWIVHHKVVLTPDNIGDPDITLNHNNLEYLCQDCHNKEHHGSKDDVVREGFMFNEYGELVPSPPSDKEA